MAAKITRDVLESYLHCKYKAHLKLAGQQGTKSDYETLLCRLSERLRLGATAKLLDCLKEGDVVRSILLTTSALKKGSLLILDGTLEDELVSARYDGLKKVDGSSALGDFYYVPIMFFQGRQFRKQQKLLLELYALLLSRLQGRVPNIGIIWRGNQCKATRVHLNPNLREGERFLPEVNKMQGAAQEPKLILNDHCQICEFRQRCHTEAVQKDNLSPLAAAGWRLLASRHAGQPQPHVHLGLASLRR